MEIEIVAAFEFNSDRKRMSIVGRMPDGEGPLNLLPLLSFCPPFHTLSLFPSPLLSAHFP